MNETMPAQRTPPSRTAAPFLTRVKIRNYKSIEACDVNLRPLTVLVGRNSSGKSNFLDALRFVAESLQTSLDHAIKSRGGVEQVRRRSTGHPRNFAIHLEMNLSDRLFATYEFEIAARTNGGYIVKRERLKLIDPNGRLTGSYKIEDGKLAESSLENMPPCAADRLYLVNAAGLPTFRGAYDSLGSMGFYNLNPESIRELQSPDAGELLHRNGGNIASVLARLSVDKPVTMQRIKSYLASIVPGITEVDRVALGPRETIEFRQEVVGSAHPWKFYAANMSDGTLRALGTLVAVMQLAERKAAVSLVGIEEPETALHPAAAGALMDALREAASHTQVVLTTHNPDLLDQIDTDKDMLLAVQSSRGTTEIGPVDAASLQAIDNHLYQPGELLRMDQLEPDVNDVKRQKQTTMFDDGEDHA